MLFGSYNHNDKFVEAFFEAELKLAKLKKYKKRIKKNSMQEIKNYLELISKKFQETTDTPFETFYTNWTYSFLAKLKNKKTSKNKFKLIDIEEIESHIPILLFDSNKRDESIDVVKSKNNKLNKSSKSNVQVLDRTGLFKFIFEENGVKEYIIFCCFLNSINEQMNIYAADIQTIEKIKNILKEEYKKQLKPKLGIFTGNVDKMGVLHYIKFEQQMSKKIIYHSVKEDILEDIRNFYKNIDQTIANKEKGTRKILIAGNQGTGKSSFINELLLSYKDTHSIMFCTDLNQWVKHQELCSKHEVPCISIIEDCEGFLEDRNSNLLNFLSGSLEYTNVKGAYTIMTTNYPNALSDRIKHRPERIDDVYILSNLEGEDLLKVVEMYFSQFLPAGFDYKTLKNVFDKPTGAEVMKYAQDVKKAANFKLGGFDKVDAAFIKKVMDEQKNKYQKLAQINTAKTSLAKSGNGFGESVGFKHYSDDEY